MFILEACGKYHGAFIELKFGKNKPTPEQIEFMQAAANRGYFAGVCWTLEDFKANVDRYFKLAWEEEMEAVA